MKHITWDDSLSVEVDEIDDDHRKLVELYNMLGQSVEDGEAWNYIDALLEELIACTVWHFRHEERLMIKYQFDEYNQHRAEHNELIEGVRAMQLMFREESRLPTDDDLKYLSEWLTGHILGRDMRLGFYLEKVME